ncbi:unnamed protein product [Lymnaea stagnalis]|uniref:Uncharacterized protein n=1 Tax=Lymnaea stagnalis TaxID=6523 RepID=A0AAV2HLP3_LYMST
MSSRQELNLMRNSLQRLVSFRYVGHLLERQDGGLGHFAAKLAKDGFFHKDNGVMCIGCKKRTSFEDLHHLGEPFHNGTCPIEEEDNDMTYIQQFMGGPQTDDAITDGSPSDILDDIGVKVKHDPGEVKHDPDFTSLATRLSSFKNVTWAKEGRGDRLARHGLYYFGVGDTLRCFQCKLQFSCVSDIGVERILHRHRQDSPACSHDSTTNEESG